MERYLITQSLLSAWSYVFNCHDGGEEDAMASFVSTLNREEVSPTQAMLDGLAFESEVYAEATGQLRPPHSEWENGICLVANKLRKAVVQVRLKRELEVNGMAFLTYGILDAFAAGVIYDVKYKVKSFGSLDLAGSYLDSAQHPMYFYLVPEATEFQYLVSDGQDLYQETYRREETRFIGDIIAEFMESITAMGLMDLYKEKWVAK